MRITYSQLSSIVLMAAAVVLPGDDARAQSRPILSPDVSRRPANVHVPPRPAPRRPWRGAFDNADLEQPALAGWINAFGERPVAAEKRRSAQAGALIPSSDIRIQGQLPARLGGDYWKVPFPALRDSIGQSGAYWLEPNAPVLTPEMTLQQGERYLTFRYKGHVDLFLVVLGPDKSTIAEHHVRASNQSMQPVTIDLGPLTPAQRQRFRLQIPTVGRDAVDDFQLWSTTPVFEPVATSPAQLRPYGVWGFVDLHAHFFNHMGFGGRIIGGTPHSSLGRTGLQTDLLGNPVNAEVMRTKTSEPRRALPDCHDLHGQSSSSAEGTLTLVPEGGHSARGYPAFTEWPRYSSKLHQQAYVDWIRRAWEGGLRVVHVDVGNHDKLGEGIERLQQKLPHVGFTAKGPGNPRDDASAIRLQVQAAKDFVSLPDVRDWAEIAMSGEEARDIVRRGKLAMVLGVEVEDMCGLGHEAQRLSPESKRAVDRCLDELHDIGIRHVIPIHTVENVFGAPAVYDLLLFLGHWVVAGRLPEMRNAFAEGMRARPDAAKDTLLKLRDFQILGYHPLRDLLDHFVAAGSSRVVDDYLAFASRWQSQAGGVGLAHARGLSDLGKYAIQRMMQKGMIIDIDHMSDLAVNDTLRLATTHHYPLVASHGGFRELSFGTSKLLGPDPQTGLPRFGPMTPGSGWTEADAAAFGTSEAGKLAAEREHTRAQIEQVRKLGGMIGIGAGGGAIPVPYRNDAPVCDGSSVAFVSAYLMAVEVMQGRGVALGTDINGLNGLAGPRFGPFACWAAAGDAERAKYLAPMVRLQKNPVRYRATAVVNASAPRFAPSAGLLGKAHARPYEPEDEMIWEAIALHKARAITARPGTNVTGTRENKTKFIAWGLFLATTGGPRPGSDLLAKEQHEWAAAAWDVMRGTVSGDKAARIKRILDQWNLVETSGTNEPLEQPVMSENGRIVSEWNYNLDGFAHYGLLPDFLQDAKNLGISANDLAPLFRGAEDYVSMWERIDAMKQAIPSP